MLESVPSGCYPFSEKAHSQNARPGAPQLDVSAQHLQAARIGTLSPQPRLGAKEREPILSNDEMRPIPLRDRYHPISKTRSRLE